MRLPLVILVTSALLVGSPGASTTTARAAAVDPQVLRSAPATLSQAELMERDVVALTNRARARKGCAPLRHVPSLQLAAGRHSALMARHRRLSHRLPGEPSLSTRVANAGFRGATLLGENIAVGYRRPAGVVRAWLNSPVHRRMMLDCRFRAAGVGMVRVDGRRWWTQDFGRR